MRRGGSAASWARGQIKSRYKDWTGRCQEFVRTSFGVGPGFRSAIDAWNGARKKHSTSDPQAIPAFVPIYWRGGRFGHAAFSLGKGRCISTDVQRRGWPDVVQIDSITNGWGYQLLGWAEDINGVTIWSPPDKRTPNITTALKASGQKRVDALRRVSKAGNKSSQAAAEKYLAGLKEKEAGLKKIAAAKAALKRLEVK